MWTSSIKINLVTTFRRRVTDIVAKLAHILDAVIAGAINLDDVEAVSGGDFATIIAHAAWRRRWTVHAIQCLSENARCRCFPDPAWSNKKIRMRQPVLGDGIFQRLRNMCLPNQIIESLWPIFAGKNLVAHGLNLNGKVDGG